MCLAKAPSKNKRKKIKLANKKITELQESQPKKSAPRRYDQPTLYESFGLEAPIQESHLTTSIIPSGDELIDKEDGILRCALQNPNGIRLRDNVDVLPEVAAIERLQIDMAAFPESKLTEFGRTREILQRQLRARIGSAQVQNAAAPRRNTRNSDFQPGGVLMAITGRVTGRILKSGNDPWGRFSWSLLRGNRNEGILFIGAYRVCQLKGTKAGPDTAFMQQVEGMLDEELRDSRSAEAADKRLTVSIRRSMDPRDRILQDLKQLINDHRSKGFRPILFMDANEDWTNKKSGQALRAFLQETQLQDPLYDKFKDAGLTASTYSRGSRRIDYMFFDQSLLSAIKRIGTLGLHEAVVSDHVMLYVDLDEKELFQGLINRPVRIPCREFILAQADKCKKFIDEFRKLAEEHDFAGQAQQLVLRLQLHGPTAQVIKSYNDLDNRISDAILLSARRIVKKKFGYPRSPELGQAGLTVNFWKSVKSSIYRRAALPEATIKIASKLEIDPSDARSLSRKQVLANVRQSISKLREVQYEASQRRQDWLEKNAQDIARAAGIDDWRKHMEQMLREEKEREVNRKLTAITKGPRQSLDWIEVPTGEWYYSHKKKEIYRYNKGVFEAYSAWSPSRVLIPDSPWRFYKHHHLKVPHDDIVEATVEINEENIILQSISLPSQIWRTVTDTAEIENLLLERNKRHLQQSDVEEGRVHNPIIQSLLPNHGTDLLEEVLSGTISTDSATDEVVKAWLVALQQTDTEKALPPITGGISKEEFQAAFKAVSEHTSSSPSGIHYSLWKCLAREDDLAEWLSIMMSLPFEYGFMNERWTNSLDVMLEKKRGQRKIHTLRIIALVEADWNTALKILFRNLMRNAEKSGLSDEQWGSRKNRMALDPAMRNLMTFEYGRYMRITIAMFAADLTACFDRMWPSLGNVTCGKFGLQVAPMKSRGETIQNLKRAVRTGHGVSQKVYQNTPNDYRIIGELQGKGDVALIYMLLSSTVLEAHSTLYHGIDLPPATPGPGIKKLNDGYVDDVNTWAGNMGWDSQAAEEAMYDLQNGAQSLTDLNETPGGSTAFHKCATQLLSWYATKDCLKINYDIDSYKISLQDAVGATSMISQLKPNEANKGLGYHFAVDASQAVDFEARLDKVTFICSGAQSTRLSYSEGLQLLNQRMLAQTKYGLHLSQFSPSQCQQLSVLTNETFLPILHLHRKMSRTVIWGPKGLGGLELNTNIYNVQAQCALTYLIRTIRWNQTVANDIIATLNALQLASGFEHNLLEVTSPKIKYLGPGWLLNLREMLDLYQASLWIERAWRPRKQRQYDESIMEVFANDSEITPKMLLMANEFRIWLGVFSVSDLANIAGNAIEIERIRNDSEWRATPASGFHWPNTVQPSNKHREIFRKCLRLTFCPQADKYSRTKDYPLLQKLGTWYPVQRMIQYTAYRSKDRVYYRDEMGLHECTERRNGFYPISDILVDEPPIKSHPIEPNMSDSETFWTHKRRKLVLPYRPKKVRIVTRDDLPQDWINHIDLVSDAAVHVDKEKGAITWHAVTQDNRRLSMDIPIEVDRYSYSYRHELIGVYEGLSELLLKRRRIRKITCHCDNEAGIEKIKRPIYNPGAMTAADMDIVLAIKQLIEDHPKVHITFQHVNGHADKDKPKNKCTRIEQINIDCDEEAEKCVERNIKPTPYEPLPGAKCMLKVSGSWVSARVDKAIQMVPATIAQEKYLVTRLRVEASTIPDIDSEVIAAARSNHTWPRLARTSKMMNYWLPVGHNWRHHGADNDKCPCCGQPDETFHHLLQCTNERMRKVCQDSIKHIEKIGATLKLPASIMWLTLRILKQECTLEDSLPPTEPKLLKIWEAQSKIGFSNFVLGWFSRSWRDGFSSFGSDDPSGQTAQLLTLLWDGLCEPIWACRNDIRTNNPNPKDLLEMSNLRSKLEWYKKFKAEVLPHRLRFLADYSQDDIRKWDRDRRQSMVRMLDKSKRIYEIEIRQKVAGQRVMTEYLRTLAEE